MKKYIPLLVILLIASLQFILILRHKSAYTSDSYFYKHMTHVAMGATFDEAYSEVIKMVDLENADKITKNIFTDKEQYQQSLLFFVKRPFYPLVVATLLVLTSHELFSFIFPVFIGYLGSIAFVYCIAGIRLKPEYQALVTVLFISFYPFLDLSTYLMTDTIGFLFWLALLYIGFRYTQRPSKQGIFLYISLLILSVLNREQTLLMSIVFLFYYLLSNAAKKGSIKRIPLQLIIAINIAVLTIYLIIMNVLKFPSLLDTIQYTQNSYGLENNSFSFGQTARYLIQSVVVAHKHVVMDLIRNRGWFVTTSIGILYIVVSIKNSFRNMKSIDILILGSMTASYFGIFLYPVLSYRYFYPVIFGLIYFASFQLQEFFAGDSL